MPIAASIVCKVKNGRIKFCFANSLNSINFDQKDFKFPLVGFFKGAHIIRTFLKKIMNVRLIQKWVKKSIQIVTFFVTKTRKYDSIMKKKTFVFLA